VGPLRNADVSDLPIQFGSEVGLSISRRRRARIPRLLAYIEEALGDVLDAADDSAHPLPRDRTGIALGTTLGLIDELGGPGSITLAESRKKLDLGGAMDAVASDAGLLGPLTTLSLACASGQSAAELAASQIALGRADAMLVVGADTLGRFMQGGFCTLRGFAPPGSSRERALSLGEGAAIVALEPLEAARTRGREVRAVLAGQRLASDGYHLVSPDPSGAGMNRAVELAIRDADLKPPDIGAVVLSALGSPVHEKVLAVVLQRVLGEHARHVPISSHELAIGHVLAASSITALAYAGFSIEQGKVHGAFPLDALGSKRLPSETVELTKENVLTVSVGFGGFNGVAVVSAVRSR
jgi:3-oxoacyl-[acyl-carrier-protein] synthase II